MKIFSYSVLIISTLAFNVWAFNELSINQSLSIEQGNTKKIFVDVGAGALDIRGADVDEISVKARIYSKKYRHLEDLEDAFQDKMEFSLIKENTTIVLKAINKKSMFSFSTPNISVDLDITIPESMNLEIEDGSGDMKIFNIGGQLKIDDGSGSTYIKQVGGGLYVEDGSGHLNISNIIGDVHIGDGSGMIDIVDISGNLTINDGSGSIDIRDLDGDFKLDEDGSGEIFLNGKRWHIN
jgi:DUF4097 and DUF4098 domain-containing protein YvlB